MGIFTRGLRVAAAGAAVVAVLGACATTAGPDEVVAQYAIGVNGGNTFKECIQPNTKGDGTVNDENYVLPVTLGTWNIRPDGQGGDSSTPITSGTLPKKVEGTTQAGPEVDVYTKTEFYLNTDCGKKDAAGNFTDVNAPLIQWWEKTGRRFYRANPDGDWWRDMLLNTLVPAVEKSVRQGARGYDADVLDAGTDNSWARMEAQLAPMFETELTTAMGGANYFCGAQYARNSDGSIRTVRWQETALKAGQVVTAEKGGPCPPVRISILDVKMHDLAITAARNGAYVAEQESKARLTKARADKQVADLAQDPNVMRLREMENERAIAEACARGSGCTLIQGVNPGGVNVTAGK